MILTLLLIAALAGVLTPLILRDLRRAVARQQWRVFVRRYEAAIVTMREALKSFGVTGAVAAARLREGLR